MQKALLIAEKPSLKRTIEAVYNKHKSEIPYEITFMEQRGHLLTLKNPNELDEDLKKWEWDTLPINPEDYGGWKYKVIEDKKTGKFLTAKERYVAIKNEIASGKYDFVINAGDPDQEGELLIRIVLSALKCSLPIKRYWSNFTTEEKVLEALKNLKDDEHDPMLVNLLEAAYARQHADWRFGMNISRAATLKMALRCACGRVRTTILGIVCRRENEIANFRPTTRYGVKVNYSESFPGQLYDDKAPEEEDEKDEAQKGIVWFDTEEEAQNVIDAISGLDANVLSYETKRTETYAPKLFKLATAQIAAGKMGYTSSKTLEIIQSLYEKGFVSYPRTDCEFVSSGENFVQMLKSAMSVPELEPYIKTISSSVIGKVKATKKWVNDAKLKESGHSAIVPSTKKPDFSALTSEEQDIYRLICRQFVAIFLPPLVQDKTLLIADIDGNKFKSTGKTLIDAGYTTIFGTKFSDVEIPKHESGDILKVDSAEISTKTSTCPKRFTDADLIAVCEAPHKFLNDKSLKAMGNRLKIGTPATRAGIIQELITRDKYMDRIKEKKTEYIVPTEIGMAIYENLKDCDICKVDMTGIIEEKLEAVRAGSLPRKDLEEEIKSRVEDMIEQIKSMKMTPLGATREEICDCPVCGGRIISSDKGFYCTNYKTEGIMCKFGAFKKICDSMVTDDEFLKLINGEHIHKEIKKGGNSWTQELMYDMDEYKIQFVQKEKAEPKESAYDCPNCGEPLMDKGKLLSCDCGFTFWKTSCKKDLTDDQIESFFRCGDTGVIKGLVGKSGKKFDARIVLKEDKSGTEFKFD